jgi:predicted Fe-Mo cluster-binding NifX family protein
MKIAVVTDDEQTISQHFGRAKFYAILTIAAGQVVGRQIIAKTAHHHVNQHDPHHQGGHHDHDHRSMIDPIADCQALLARGMGTGAHEALKARGIRPIITDLRDIDQAAQAYLDGNITDHPEKLH